MKPTTENQQYLQALELYSRNTREENGAAVSLFKEDLEVDPNYAPAYAGLSLAYRREYMYHPEQGHLFDDAISAGEKAIELDSHLTQGYYALARLYMSKRWVGKMQKIAQIRVELKSSDGSALEDLGWLLWSIGQADRALPHIKKAIAINPTSAWAHFYLGNASLALELYDQAEHGYRRSVELDNLSSGEIGLISTYLSQDKTTEAVEENMRFRANHDQDRYYVKAADVELLLGNLKEARLFAEQGVAESHAERYFPRGVLATTILGCLLWEEDQAEGERRLDQSRALDMKCLDDGEDSFAPFYDLAAVYAIRGDRVEACRWLDRAVAAGWRNYRLAMRDPMLRNLLHAAHFEQMMRATKAKVEESRKLLQTSKGR